MPHIIAVPLLERICSSSEKGEASDSTNTISCTAVPLTGRDCQQPVCEETRTKPMCLHVGFVHDVQAVLVAQLIPASQCQPPISFLKAQGSAASINALDNAWLHALLQSAKSVTHHRGWLG